MNLVQKTNYNYDVACFLQAVYFSCSLMYAAIAPGHEILLVNRYFMMTVDESCYYLPMFI